MSYLLDTNVISELRKLGDGKAHPGVVAWIAAHDDVQFFMSAISVLEIERGILTLHRRDPAQAAQLRTWFDLHVRPAFEGRILPVDDEVATRCAQLHVPDRRGEADALIAATALKHGFAVVTRNLRDFEGTGVVLIDPWQAS